MPTCTNAAPSGLITGLMNIVDCYVGEFAQGAYRDLVGPDTVFAAVLTAMLTIYIGVMGYQLLLGRGGMRLADLPLTAMKIGLILAFLTSWAAYQTVVYDFLFLGPQQIAGVLLAQVSRLNADFGGDVFLGLEKAFISMTSAATIYGQQAGANGSMLQGGPALASGLLWLAAVTMVLSTVGLVLAAKIVLGFLLAVGPIFIGLFLFDATRGFFDGWLRTTIAFALAPLAAIVFSAAMLLMLDPFLVKLVEVKIEDQFDMGTVVSTVIVVSVFVIVMSQVLRVGFGITGGFRLPRSKGGARTADNTVTVSQTREDERARDNTRTHTAGSNSSTAMEASTSSSRESRRVVEIANATAIAPAGGARLGDSYRRTPLPAQRRKIAGEGGRR